MTDIAEARARLREAGLPEGMAAKTPEGGDALAFSGTLADKVRPILEPGSVETHPATENNPDADLDALLEPLNRDTLPVDGQPDASGHGEGKTLADEPVGEADAGTDSVGTAPVAEGEGGGDVPAAGPQSRKSRIDDAVPRYFGELHREIGWDQRGGLLLREAERADGLKAEVAGRTKWVGKPSITGEGESNFWRHLPEKTSEKDARDAFTKLEAGERLTPKQQRFIEYARKTAQEYAEAEEVAREDFARSEGHDSVDAMLEHQRKLDEDAEIQRAIDESFDRKGPAPDYGGHVPFSKRPEQARMPEQGAPKFSKEADSEAPPAPTGNPITDNLATRLHEDHAGAVAEYNALPDSRGGVVLNTDIARELSPEYRADRTKSADVHEPASAFIKKVYAEKLAQPTPEGMDSTVLFTAGGTGAGKTTGERAAGAAFGKPEIVYDTNMNKLESSDKKIQQALAAGRKVGILYTYRDPVDALVNGALQRADRMEREQGTGRTVPLEEHEKTHVGARKTIEALFEKYKNNPDVGFKFVDNSRGRGNHRAVERLEDLPEIGYDSSHGLEDKIQHAGGRVHPQTERGGALAARLQAALDAEHAAGRISDAVYQGFAGRPPNRPGSDSPGQASKLSKAPEPSPANAGLSVSDARSHAKKGLGRGVINRLEKNGILNILTADEAVARSVEGNALGKDGEGLGPISGIRTKADLDGVKGIYDPATGKAYVIADNVKPDEVAGTILHEIGIHFGVAHIVTPKTFNSIVNHMRGKRATDADVKRAYDSVPEDTPKAHVNEEALAYLAEQSPKHTIVTRLLDAMKRGLNRLGMPMHLVESQTDAIRRIARENLRAASRVRAPRASSGNPMYQRVFHGTPHRGIEKEGFKLNKIGTGEGAQAYGWGTYFAGKRDIAEGYRDRLSRNQPESVFVNGRDVSGDPWLAVSLRNIRSFMQDRGQTFDAAKESRLDDLRARLGNLERGGNPDAIREIRQTIRDLEAVHEGDVTGARGQLYHAEIPEDHDLLDWDKPLSEQPEKVREAIIASGLKLPPTASGKQIYEAFAHRAVSSREPSQRSGKGGDPEAASEYLNSIGIPGLRYLDGGSRNANWKLSTPEQTAAGDWMVKDSSQPNSKGLHFDNESDARAELERRQQTSHNYVIWDENLLTPEKAGITPYYSRTQATKDAYEKRIDTLYSGGRPKRPGIRVLDRSDILDMLGMGNRPVVLNEGKVNADKHSMTADDWKKVPAWLENPAAVFDSTSVPDRLVFIAPKLVNGASVRLIVEPGEKGQLSLLVNAFDARGHQPYMEWARDGLLRYLHESKSPGQVGRSRLQLPGLPTSTEAVGGPAFSERSGLRLPRDVRQLRGYDHRVLTDSDLFKYRAERDATQAPPSEGLSVPKLSKRASNRDTAYMDAVNRGDMDTAQRMVDEAARDAGYGRGSDYRDAHVAPSADVEPSQFRDLDALRESVEDSNDTSLYAAAHGITNVPSDYFTSQGARYYGFNTPEGHESLAAIRKAMDGVLEGNDSTITVYRAVPKDIKEGATRNRGWVTPSEQYARNHARSRFGYGEYRIIKQEVKPEHLWWDGNDINEWGFDDGSDYAYQNTKNNRKLLDAVTRDDDGNVIPLSKRFNKRNEDVRFSRRDTRTSDMSGALQAPEREESPRNENGDLFGGPSARDRLGAAERAKDAARTGGAVEGCARARSGRRGA